MESLNKDTFKILNLKVRLRYIAMADISSLISIGLWRLWRVLGYHNGYRLSSSLSLLSNLFNNLEVNYFIDNIVIQCLPGLEST
jgi:hypothetical protein